MKLQKKFRLGIILLVFIPVLIMGTVSYVFYSGMIEHKTYAFYRVSLQDTDRKLEFALNEISTLSDLAITQPVLQQILKEPPERIGSELAQALNHLIMVHPKITAFRLYSGDKLIYSTAGPAAEPHTLDDFPWSHEMSSLKGRPLWLGPGENGTYDSGNPVLLHARIIKDYYSLKDIGAIVITVKPDVLEQALWGANTIDGSDILLLNREGKVVWDRSGASTGRVLPAHLLEHDEEGYQFARFNDADSMLTTVSSSREGWLLTAVTPVKELQKETGAIRNVALGLLLFSLLMCLIFERLFVMKLVRTIVVSARGMKRVEQGQFIELKSPTGWRDETGMLVNGFNQMSRQISDLLNEVKKEQKRKKEAEMHALVAQINPHFIYNSLESINSMAVLAGNRDISRIVISLGKLLRISINENVESIPLSMELEHVKHYLDIQKMRFRDQFDYAIVCPDELKSCMTLKLIVQPLVENALYHGIETKQEPGFIRIEVTESQSQPHLFIDVADTGSGFDHAQFEKLWSVPAAASGLKYRHSGVGLKNVFERIRIQYGPPFGLMICSSQGFGTIIRIRIPKII
ncbi:cache domain-containing sensor histidine kinase [Paenibacillus senegalensis]|uniref:cache domain-containing sensor histidine kinase n=1 Tax=Paenibacillus senegalensis TaxID=1465766 RepID=UPI000289F355|nr:sensor histidine kinase [Paenibacillus senegalensis]